MQQSRGGSMQNKTLKQKIARVEKCQHKDRAVTMRIETKTIHDRVYSKCLDCEKKFARGGGSLFSHDKSKTTN